MVIAKDERGGTLELGTGAGRRFHNSAELEQAFQSQLPVEGHITRVSKGGVVVHVAGVRAFCPASQLDTRYIEDLETFTGQRLTFRITAYQGGRHPNIVLSRRVARQQAPGPLASLGDLHHVFTQDRLPA